MNNEHIHEDCVSNSVDCRNDDFIELSIFMDWWRVLYFFIPGNPLASSLKMKNSKVKKSVTWEVSGVGKKNMLKWILDITKCSTLWSCNRLSRALQLIKSIDDCIAND